MNIQITSHFAEQVMEVTLRGAAAIDTEMLSALQKRWSNELLKWHSPYIGLIDFGGAAISKESLPSIKRFFSMLRGFHMRKVGACSLAPDSDTQEAAQELFNACADSRESLVSALKLDSVLNPREGHIPSLIRVEPFFDDLFMEVSFTRAATFHTADDVDILKRRFEVLLKQWHTGYSVLVDCRNLAVDDEAFPAFEALMRFLQGFFCRAIVGHSARRGLRLPFPLTSTRHEALEAIAPFRNAGSGKSAFTCSRNDLGGASAG